MCDIFLKKNYPPVVKDREAYKHGNVILGSVGGQGGSVENKNDYLWNVMSIV